MPEYLGVQQRCEAAGLDIVEGWVGSTMGVVISDKIRSIYEQGERDDVLFLRPAPERDSTELEMQQEHVHVEQVQCPAIQQCHVCMAAQFKEIFCDSDMAALKEIADKFDKDGNALVEHEQLNAIGATVTPDSRWLWLNSYTLVDSDQRWIWVIPPEHLQSPKHLQSPTHLQSPKHLQSPLHL